MKTIPQITSAEPRIRMPGLAQRLAEEVEDAAVEDVAEGLAAEADDLAETGDPVPRVRRASRCLAARRSLRTAKLPSPAVRAQPAARAQPPIGALGLAPQKIWEPIMPIRCTSTMFKIIDLAVAWPTPTGPPEAV